MASKLLALEILEKFWMGWQNKRNKIVQLQYLTIFENQILCLKRDGDWQCNCGTLQFNEKCEVRLFIKRFKERSCYYKKTLSKKMAKSKRFEQKNTSIKQLPREILKS